MSALRRSSPRAHAIYAVLNDAPFIRASLDSVYPFASEVTVITAVDRNWAGEAVKPDGTLEQVLEFPDPDNKLNVMRVWVPDEALARNLAMHAALHRVTYRFEPHEVTTLEARGRFQVPDYFWIVDGDEIYDPETVPDILDYVLKSRANLATIVGILYFKTWNYRVDVKERFTAFVRPGLYLGLRRNPIPNRLVRTMARVPRVGVRAAERISGWVRIPESVGTFHHGAYVGDDQRIAEKVASHSHRKEFNPNWFDDVWKVWTPSSKNFHPVWPEVFPSAHSVPTNELPAPLRNGTWPEGYFDAAGRQHA